MNEESTELADSRIHLSKRHYLTVSVLASILLWAVVSTFYLTNYFSVAPLKEKIADKDKVLEVIDGKLKTLESQKEELGNKYNLALGEIHRPILLAPLNNSSIIGTQVGFAWDYGNGQSDVTNYLIEIQCLDQDGSDGESKTFNVPRAKEKAFYYPTSRLKGRCIWRVKPGLLLGAHELSFGDWSGYQLFTAYPSVLDRIKCTGKVCVGIAPTIANNFEMVNGNGWPYGFDIDLIKLIAESLSKKYAGQCEIKWLDVEIQQLDWNELLPSLRDHAIDAVISSMTKSKAREDTYGVRFSRGYFPVHQVFVAKRGVYDDIKSLGDLSKKKIGVSKNTTNQGAAKFLADKFGRKVGFEVVDTFSQYEEVFQAINDNRVDLALVDSVLVKQVINDSNGRLKEVDLDLDKYLKDYHLRELGQESEELAIAVSGGEVELLGDIDEALKEIESKLPELEKAWGL